MSDPDGLRAGVEKLIAEFDRDIQHGHDPYYIGVQAGRRAAADAARSLLAKHPPTPPEAEQHRLGARVLSLRARELEQAVTQSAREIRRLEKALEVERQRRAQVEQALRGLLEALRGNPAYDAALKAQEDSHA